MIPHLRVIAGSLRGARLDAPSDTTTRPITDRAKESLFNILGHRLGTLGELPPFAVLDLFAGSGSMGIEALSRGARRCTFVERDRRAVRILRENIARTRLSDRATVLCENAWAMRLPTARPETAATEAGEAAAIETGDPAVVETGDPAVVEAGEAACAGSVSRGGFGLVFADPPYRDSKNAIMVADLLDRVAARLAPAGLVVLRHGPDAAPPEETAAGLICLDHRTLKRMHLLIYGRREPSGNVDAGGPEPAGAPD